MPPWTLGGPDVQQALHGLHLATDAVHELKPAAPAHGQSVASGWSSVQAFALALAGRRLHGALPAGHAPAAEAPLTAGTVLWCTSSRRVAETGRLYGPGLATFGLAPTDLLLVEVSRASDLLWAMEEGMRTAGLALVVGHLDAIALTPARRLALAAKAHAAPCLLLTDARTPAAAATTTRWRIASRPSDTHPFDPAAPGAPRLAVTLERWRGGASQAAISCDSPPLALEWCHETLCFRVVPRLRHRQDAPQRAARRAG